MGYMQNLVSRWDLSTVNPQDIGWRGLGNHGTGTGLVAATDIVEGIHSGSKATEFNGADESTDMGDVGTIRAVALWVRPATTTEELFKTAVGRDVMVNAGTVTYAGVAASATYVDGEASTTLVAGVWQHLVCVFDSDEAADSFELATDGTNFGAVVLDEVMTFGAVLTQLQARDLWNRTRRGTL